MTDDTTALFTLMACIGRVEAGYREGMAEGPAIRGIDALLAHPSSLIHMGADALMPLLLQATHPKLTHLAWTLGVVFAVHEHMKTGGEE